MILLLVSFALALLCVGIHFEFLLLTSSGVQHMPGPHRLRVVAAITIAIGAHLLEVFIFAVGWMACIRAGIAKLNIPDPTWGDVFYYSGAVYTSLGFGDIVPVGSARSLASVEAVTGLVMIAWTASFTYFEMHENWSLNSKQRS